VRIYHISARLAVMDDMRDHAELSLTQQPAQRGEDDEKENACFLIWDWRRRAWCTDLRQLPPADPCSYPSPDCRLAREETEEEAEIRRVIQAH
jgi:hypothetical protein